MSENAANAIFGLQNQMKENSELQNESKENFGLQDGMRENLVLQNEIKENFGLQDGMGEDSVLHNEMKENMVELTKTYKKLEVATYKVICAVYGTDKIRLPIDIERIAGSLGISVDTGTLFPAEENRYSQTLGHLASRNGTTRILLNPEVSYKTQRYTIAHAVGSYLLQWEQAKKFIFTSTYAIPLIPQSMEDIMADVVALFLLLPRKVFQKEFKKYLEYHKDYPMDVNEWMEYLANKSQIPFFNLSIGYQQLKQMLSWEREEEFFAEGFDINKKDSYDIIFA